MAQESISPSLVIDIDPFSTTSSVTKPIPIPEKFTEKINAPIPREKMAFFFDLAHDKIFNDRTIPNGQKIQFASLFRPAWHAYTEEMIDGFIEGRISVKAFIAMLPPLKPCFFDVHAPPRNVQFINELPELENNKCNGNDGIHKSENSTLGTCGVQK